jgi:hypothetical protein
MCHRKDPPIDHVNVEGAKRLLPDGRSELLDGHDVESAEVFGFRKMRGIHSQKIYARTQTCQPDGRSFMPEEMQEVVTVDQSRILLAFLRDGLE